MKINEITHNQIGEEIIRSYHNQLKGRRYQLFKSKLSEEEIEEMRSHCTSSREGSSNPTQGVSLHLPILAPSQRRKRARENPSSLLPPAKRRRVPLGISFYNSTSSTISIPPLQSEESQASFQLLPCRINSLNGREQQVTILPAPNSTFPAQYDLFFDRWKVDESQYITRREHVIVIQPPSLDQILSLEILPLGTLVHYVSAVWMRVGEEGAWSGVSAPFVFRHSSPSVKMLVGCSGTYHCINMESTK